jgi:PBP1b-binding outer membrane lipoprotein LpoB
MVVRKKMAAFTVLAGALLLGACASQDSVQHAQSTADQALQLAQTANQKADAANAKIDRMFQKGLQK